MGKQELNGTDVLMLAFDYQLKKTGLAGNIAQIILGLAEQIPADAFRQRLARLAEGYPLLNAMPRRSLLRRTPYWQVGANPATPDVVSHFDDTPTDTIAVETRKREIFNRPLNIAAGENIRFDLLYLPDGRMEVIMTWNHILMDAHGAEYFLLVLGGDGADRHGHAVGRSTPPPIQQRVAATTVAEKWRATQRAFGWIDSKADLNPRSLYTSLAPGAAPSMDYRIEAFSAEETRAVGRCARKLGGVLNDSSFFLAATMKAFDRLNRRKGVAPEGYVVSFPVSLRRIGTREPMFSNQAGTLLYGFSREDTASVPRLVDRFSEQTRAAVKSDLLFANLCLLDLSRRLPLWFYLRKIRQSYRGEIASLVFANPGDTLFGKSRFMGIEVTYQHHVPMIVMPPGIGVVFYFFDGRLTVTIVFAPHLVSAAEAREFGDQLRVLLAVGE